MAQSTNQLAAKPRQDRGKGPARRLRAAGLIPAVVYGQKREPTHVSVDPAAITKAIATPHKLNTLITLKVGGADKRVLLREYEVDPVSRELLHADFLEVALDKAVKKANDDLAKWGDETTSFMGLEKPWFELKNPGLISIPLGFLGVFLGSLLVRDRRAESMWDEVYARQNVGIQVAKPVAH